jgi:hypothetical protein
MNKAFWFLLGFGLVTFGFALGLLTSIPIYLSH